MFVALGVVTESLTRNEAPPEIGFMTVLAVEPIYACVEQHFQLDEEIGAWSYIVGTIRHYRLSRAEVAKLNPRLASATISVYDDDRDVFLELSCQDHQSLASAYAAMSRVIRTKIVESQSRPGHLFVLPEDNPAPELLERAALASVEALIKKGYVLLDGSRGSL